MKELRSIDVMKNINLAGTNINSHTQNFIFGRNYEKLIYKHQSLLLRYKKHDLLPYTFFTAKIINPLYSGLLMLYSTSGVG